MNKRRIFAVFAASALALSLLAGCGNTDTPPAGDVTPPENSAPDTPQTPDTPDAPPAADSPLGDLMGVLTMPDGEVTAQLGEGTPSQAEDTLLSREYTRDVLGESATVAVIYGDDGMVSGIDILFAATTFDTALEQLTTAYGEPQTHTQSEESGGQNVSWTVGESTVMLIEAYGSVSISIAAA